MRIEHVRYLNGPNVYLSRPVAIARVELEELTDRETTDHPGFGEGLLAVLPSLAEHHCSAGRPGGLLTAMAQGTYFGHVAEHVALELSGQIGREVFFGRTVRADETPGRYDVILECPLDEPPETSVCGALLDLAVHLVHEVLAGRRPDPAATLAEIAAAYERSRLGVSTAALARAARERGVPVRRVGSLNLLQLGYGRHRHMVWAAMSDHTSAIGMEVAGDKLLTKRLLAEAGIPVPEGRTVTTPEEALAEQRAIGGPVVVKPLTGHQGEGVGIELTDPPDVLAAFAAAAAVSEEVLVESYLPGTDYRVLVVGGRMVAAAELRAAQVVGDGRADIAALVGRTNLDPARGEGHNRPLTRLALGPAEVAHLTRQGHTPQTIPAVGEVVWLRRNANLSTGGTSRDVTGVVHPDVADLCVRAAATLGLDICGLDLRLPDISAPPPGAGAGVIEVNVSPGLRMHLDPYEGPPRDVAAHVIEHLYPPGAPSRVPIVAVTGTNGKTTTVRMIAHLLGLSGARVGMACTEGVYVADELIHRADASGPRSAEMVLGDHSVEAAVLETARGGIVRRGLGYDRADVAVITNITRDHLGADGVSCLDDLIDIKALVAEEIKHGGHVVLNADDPPTAELAERGTIRGRAAVVRFFAASPASPIIEDHLAGGGIAYFLLDGWLVEAQGPTRTRILPAADVAGSFDGRAGHVIANALAAAAAGRALGISTDVVAAALRSFDPYTRNPGRGCVVQIGDNPVIVDYAHNSAAVAAIGSLVTSRWQPGVVAVTLPGDRRDDLVVDTAREIAAHFNRVVIYEDEDLRDRAPGEMTHLILSGLRESDPAIQWRTAGDLKGALTTALDLAAPGEPVLLLYEKLQPVTDLLETLT